MSTGSSSSLIAPGAMVAAKYRLEALIGEGGMGSVWSATHLGLNQTVALKIISRDFVKSAEALRRFDAEAKAAAQLRSRHVVQVFDTGALDDGTPYIAMELLHGESLQGRVHRGGPVQLAEGVDVLAQCCKALGRAHAAGIIHRDIKPDNIFLSQSNDDEGALVKILDFGVAKIGGSGNEQGSQGATRTGAVLGTPLYMSPEQARGLKTIDQRTDLYSLGLVAYTMFTGNLAFSGDSFGDLLLKICTAPLPSLAAGAPWLPPGVEGWFQKACAREPNDRYASAQEFIDGLRTAAGITLTPNRDASREMAAMSGMIGATGSSGRSRPGLDCERRWRRHVARNQPQRRRRDLHSARQRKALHGPHRRRSSGRAGRGWCGRRRRRTGKGARSRPRVGLLARRGHRPRRSRRRARGQQRDPRVSSRARLRRPLRRRRRPRRPLPTRLPSTTRETTVVSPVHAGPQGTEPSRRVRGAAAAHPHGGSAACASTVDLGY